MICSDFIRSIRVIRGGYFGLRYYPNGVVMHRLINFWTVAALLTLGTISTASAQTGYAIKIEDARIGLPPGRFGAEKDAATQKPVNVIKRNMWAPIYLNLEIKKEVETGAKIRIDSADADELRTSMTVPLTKSFSGMLPGTKLQPYELSFTPYVRCGDRSGDVTITILSDDGRDKQLAEPFRIRFQQFRDVSNYVIVSLGSRLPGFDLPSDNTQKGNARSALRGGRVEASAITNVMEMPDQWFGYQAADLVVLTTGSTPLPFLNELFGDNVQEPQRVRRDALLEWVRRGGKLIVSVGSNSPSLAQMKAFQAILPAPIRIDPPTKAILELPIYGQFPGTTINEPLRAKNDANTTFPVANVGINPTRTPRVLMPPPDLTRGDGADSQPVVLQMPFGTGRISLVTFDLDQSPFLDYNSRPIFWDWLIRECGSAKGAIAPTAASTNTWSSTGDNEDEWASTLRTHVDTFDGVPVVSFGWVALFIILYTLLIGPVEYLFLKYVLKRLELTWITFPLIVISVSAAAYFTAYAIKGNDLKINKVDVIDVDVAGGRVYGKTWFTIFSPRIDSYTIGIEPRAGWTVTQANTPDPIPLLGWMAGGSGGGGSIVSRGYSYHTDPNGKTISDGLDRVPIQVWSTKAFTANWSGYIDKGTPLVSSDLAHPPGKGDAITGSFVSNIPIETLDSTVLIYRGRVYKLGAIKPGQRVIVHSELEEDTNWFNSADSSRVVTNTSGVNNFRGGYQPVQQRKITNLSIWGMLFHERTTGSGKALMNSSMRDLDHSWRIEDNTKPRFFDEAILLANVAPPSGLAETMMTDPTGPSPTKLWLKGLPGGTTKRDPIPGTLRQETFIRVYLPIRPAAKS